MPDVSGWSVCDLPPSVGSRREHVTFYVGRRAKYLQIGQGLLTKAGLAVGDFVTIEHASTRYRVRKVNPTDRAARGVLTKNTHGPGAKFSTGGSILFAEGVAAGVFEGQAYEGSIVFDAGEEGRADRD